MTLVVVAGALANKPANGGEAWVRLSWVDGFRCLGYDVLLLEEIADEVCVDAKGEQVDIEESINLAYFQSVTASHGVSAALLASDGRTFGVPPRELAAVAAEAALLVNISGHLRRSPLLDRFRRKAYVDIDPGFTQLWLEAGVDLGVDDHDVHFTIGENIGREACDLPSGGVTWRTTRQPVVVDDWAGSRANDPSRFTTVASWRGAFGPVDHRGRRLGSKVREFRRFMGLPSRVPQNLEVALAIDVADDADRQRLVEAGWSVRNPKICAGDPERFRSYVLGSGGECSVAQGIYVETRSGWFSDRTVRYLAAGRPALVQDTGFPAEFTAEGGVVPFDTFEDAVDGALAIASDYREHAAAARRVARQCFAADVVLPRFLDLAGIAA